MMRTWLVPVLPAISSPSATMRERAAVPRGPFETFHMALRVSSMMLSSTLTWGASAEAGCSMPLTLLIRRGSIARLDAIRAVITASCSGEVRT